MFLSSQQKAIIRSIAKEEVKSFTILGRHDLYKKALEEMKEEGYDVTDSDFLEVFAKNIIAWEQIIEDPDAFLTNLNELNLNMVRHILFQRFQDDPNAKGIWKKLNILDQYNIDFITKAN